MDCCLLYFDCSHLENVCFPKLYFRHLENEFFLEAILCFGVWYILYSDLYVKINSFLKVYFVEKIEVINMIYIIIKYSDHHCKKSGHVCHLYHGHYFRKIYR